MSNEADYSNFSLLDLFNMEVKTQVSVLNNSLLALENKSELSEELATLMRAAHSIKGAARIVQIDTAVKLAHAMEDCFVAAQAKKIILTAANIDVLLQAVDMLVHIAENCIANPNQKFDEDSTIQSLIAAIANILVVEQNQNIAAQNPVVEKGSSQDSPLANQEVSQVSTLREESLPVSQKLPPNLPANQEWLGVEPFHSDFQQSQTPTITEAKLQPELQEKLNIIQNRAVRVSADNLNRLMGLAGESLVEAKWLEPFADSLGKLKTRQTQLSNLLEKLQELLIDYELTRQTQDQFNLVRQTVNECLQFVSDRHNELEQFCQRSTNLADRLYRQVIATHMCPFADGAQGFPRMVRDLARHLGKRVNLEILGKSTLVDRDILERLEAPLTHILRNAVDHGIESPEHRLAVGKPEIGNIRLEVFHRAGMLLITISDDGRGVDLEFLRQEVVKKQLTNAELAAQLTEAELMEFLFLPGFSTAMAVTEISGRGVGLDVVYSTIREVGGTLRAVSQPGKGMTFYLQLPLTLSVLRTLQVQIANEPYAFGLARIDRVVMLPRSEIALSENQPFFMLDDQPVLLLFANQVLDLPSSAENPELLPVIVISDRGVGTTFDLSAKEQLSNSQTAVKAALKEIFRQKDDRLNRYGLIVDKFLGECNLVVRPLDPRLGKVPNISAAALMDDGSPVLIFDVEDLVRSIVKVLSSGQQSQVNQSTRQAVTKTYKRVLVVDDSITVREMERKLLENKGYKVEVAVNGMDGWNAVRSGDYDLVVTDIDMPRMNGFELTCQIKAHAKLKHLPVIIVSYKDREEDRLQGLEAGADYYLTKSSFHDHTMLQAVIDLIGEA